MHSEIVKHSKCGEFPKNLNWSVHDWKKVEPGDFFLLCQIGTKNDGITAMGIFDGFPELSKDKRGGKKRMHYANIFFDFVFDREEFPDLLSSHVLNVAFPNINWNSGYSGELVSENLAPRIISYVSNMVSDYGANWGKLLWNI